MRYKKFLRWFYQITDEIKHHLQKSFTFLPVLRYKFDTPTPSLAAHTNLKVLPDTLTI